MSGYAGNIELVTSSTGSHIFISEGGERMRIASNGNIGIGNNNPANILQVGGGGRLRIANGASDYTLIGASDVESATNTRIAMYGNTHGAGYAGNMEYMATSTGNHMFFTGGTGTTYGAERLRIASNGNIGIGNNNPLALLDITYAAPSLPDIRDMLNIKTDGNWGLKVQQSSSAGNIQYNVIHRYLTVDYNSLTFKGANVGIGTNAPTHKLEVFGSSTTVSISSSYYGVSGQVGSYNGPYDYVSAKFSGAIWCTYYVIVSSDVRIKENIQDINDDNALQSILSIEPKTYKYVDKLERGDKKVYGFIAQQIREVIPEAVSIQTSYIPNIYLVADYNSNVITLPSQPTKVVIKINDKIKCYDKDNKELLVEVIEVIDDLTFRIKDIEYSDTKIFVYGTFVDDFHTLNKDYIFTLNVCATQELHRRIEAQNVVIQSHEDRIKELETKMERILSNNT